MPKKKPFAKLGISWKKMKVGKVLYEGTYDGAKANVCRANSRYAPKTWRTFSKGNKVYVERLPDEA